MDLIMLGTGHAAVTRCYNSCFVLENDEGRRLLVDGGGGNGLLRQLELAEIPWTSLHEIYLSHQHTDHLLGIIWLLRFITAGLARGSYPGTVTIHAHRDLAQLLRQLTVELFTARESATIDHGLFFDALDDGDCRSINGHKICFFDIHSTKAKQFGFKLQLDATAELCFLGDEPYNPSAAPYARGVRWLLHEAFCLKSEAERFKPYEKMHSTAADAAALAAELGVERLLLHHTEDSHLAERKALYTAEAAKYFSGQIVVPDDLERLHL